MLRRVHVRCDCAVHVKDELTPPYYNGAIVPWSQLYEYTILHFVHIRLGAITILGTKYLSVVLGTNKS